MTLQNWGLAGLMSNLSTESVWGCSASFLNGLPAPTNATLSAVSMAGVDQIPPPANWSLGWLGGWRVQVFLITRPVLASRKFMDPWNASRSAWGPSSAAPPETPI